MASEKLSSAPLILLVLFYGGVQRFTEENTMFQLQISVRSKRFRGVGEQRNSKEQDFVWKRLLRRLTPNALWHIDSNHKLIRWRLITHVCVDEYSRIIIYAHCCNNNKADTVVVVCVRSLLLWSIKVTSSTYQCSVCFNLCDLNLEVIEKF